MCACSYMWFQRYQDYKVSPKLPVLSTNPAGPLSTQRRSSWDGLWTGR